MVKKTISLKIGDKVNLNNGGVAEVLNVNNCYTTLEFKKIIFKVDNEGRHIGGYSRLPQLDVVNVL